MKYLRAARQGSGGEAFEAACGRGPTPTPANLARKLGVSRARVTQIGRLLHPAPEVLNAIAALGDPMPSPIVTERKLRPLVNLPPEEQRRRIGAILAGRSRKS